MNLNLTTKERFLLEDQKSQEQMCVDKYNSYANLASCSELKNLLTSIGQIEQQHLNTINQLLSGQIPSVNSQGQQSQQSQGQQSQGQQSQMASQQQMNFQSSQKSQQQMQMGTQNSNSQYPKNDKDICSDLLMTEKHVSNAYDTTIFEFTNSQARDVLNHIQKEEQEHGYKIFKYMESKGMYTPK